MGEIRIPLAVKLFVGLLTAQPDLIAPCTDALRKEFGPIEFESDLLPWDRSDYYQEELGVGIKRKFLFFERLLDPGVLPAIKLFTNDLEKKTALSVGPLLRRKINVDPGYITEAKVVLATTKDFSHRLYIGENIYGEVTLRYSTKDRSFTAHEFTFPDFRTREYLALFNGMRDSLRATLRQKTEK